MIFHLIRFELRLNRAVIFWVSLSLFLFQIFFVAFYTATRPDETMTGLFNRIPGFMRSLMGGSYVDLLSLNGFLSYGMTHPMVLFLLWAAIIALTSRGAVASGGMGLADIFHSQPVSRTWILLCRAAAGEIAGLIIILSFYLGHLTGTLLFTLPTEPDRTSFFYIAVNAYAYFLAVQGTGILVASFLRHRSSAVGATVAVLAVMFFLNIFDKLWPLFDLPARLSFLTYYVPGRVLVNRAFPWEDVLILIGFYILTFIAALVVFNRRDL